MKKADQDFIEAVEKFSACAKRVSSKPARPSNPLSAEPNPSSGRKPALLSEYRLRLASGHHS